MSDGERQAPTRIEETEVTHLARYQFALDYILPQHTVLDAPCGSGYGTALIASRGARVYGVDINEGAIQHAKEFFSIASNSFHISNLEDLVGLFPKSDCLDLIVSFEGIEHLEHPSLFLNEARRLLKPNGSLIISTPRKPHGSPFHIKEYSLKEFEEELSSHFKIERIFGQVYTHIFDLGGNNVNPHEYRKFNFIVYCSPKKD